MCRERARNSLGCVFVAQVCSQLLVSAGSSFCSALLNIPRDNSAHPHSFYLIFLSFLKLLFSVKVGLCLEEAIIHLLTAGNSYVEYKKVTKIGKIYDVPLLLLFLFFWLHFSVLSIFLPLIAAHFSLQMRELVSGLHHDAAVRVVIFRSLVPGVFCAGQLSSRQKTYIQTCNLHVIHLLEAISFVHLD